MVRKGKGGEEVGQSSRGAPSKRARGATMPRRDANTLPYNHFWDIQGHTNFYEDEVHRKKGRNDEYIRTIAGNDRVLCPALALKLDFLESNYFENLARIFLFQGWRPFLRIAINYEPSMIRQFYHNWKPQSDTDENGLFETKVYGRIISVSSSVLNSYFGQEDELNGAQLDGQNFTEYCPDYNVAHARRSLLDPSCRNRNSSLVSDFTLENRLLFHILTKLIIPRSGSFTKITDYDVGIMYFLRNNIKICLGHLMCTHIAGIAHNKTRSCAYLMPLTHFLINECEIPSNPNDSIHPKQIWYDEKILRLLFTQNVNTGVWERKYTSQNLQPDEAPSDTIQEPMHIENNPSFQAPFDNPSSQPDFNPSANQGFPSSSSYPPPQAQYDPFQSSYNPLTYQHDMFSMMQSMHNSQVNFANEVRGRFDEQDRNINEINDALAEVTRNFHYL